MPISIIIPTLNEAATLATYLMALQQFRLGCEIIVVDGGSQDATVNIASPYADLVILADAGRANQMNVGAQHAQGDILLFLHADTLLPEDALDLIQQALIPQQQWGRFDIELKGEHLLLPVIATAMNWRSRLTGIATGDQGIFVTRSAFQAVNQYTNQALMEDIDLCKKLNRLSPPVCISAKAISSARRWEQFGIVKTMLLMWSLRLRYFFGASPETLAQLYRQGVFWKT
ncbi:MAG: glycosyltransferase family 2 protein [Methylococcaceae bacterium]|nr:glycosyltransferase family 2 protein [Methylococcaceae bacterium]